MIISLIFLHVVCYPFLSLHYFSFTLHLGCVVEVRHEVFTTTIPPESIAFQIQKVDILDTLKALINIIF